MKKTWNIITCLLLTGAILQSCGSGSDGAFEISGVFTGAGGQTAKIEAFQGTNPVLLDSAPISDNGEFKLSIDNPALDFYRISLDEPHEYIILITDSTQQPHVEAEYPGINSNYAVTGSKDTELLVDFYRRSTEFDNEIQELKSVYTSTDPADTTAMLDVNGQIIELNNSYYEYIVGTITENASSPACLSILAKLSPQQDLDKFKMVEAALRPRMAHNPFNVNRISVMIQQTEAALQQQQAQQAQQAQQDAMLAGGKEATDITMNNPDGVPMSLSSLRGKVVLLDFWASWCRPCRAENPAVVALYNKYKSKGFDIFSVSLDKDPGRWKQAIQQDGLVWDNHVSDLAGWNSAGAALYGVRSIPFTVLIDRDGKIIATKLRGAALESKLEEIFGS